MEHADVELPLGPADAEHDRARWQEFARSPSRELRNQLVERYIGLAKIAAARFYQRRVDNSVPFADYLQYARVGLVEAIDHFDPARGVPFEAFSSYRIKGAVLNGLEAESEQSAQRAFWSRRARDRFDSIRGNEARGDRRSSLEELVNLTVGLVLSEVMDHEGNEPIDDTLASNPYAMTELLQLRRAVRRLLPSLPEREREIIRRHYEEQVEFQQIAQDWGVTKGRVSQLHAQALKRLRELLVQPPRVDSRL